MMRKRWTDMKVIRIYTGKKRLRCVSKGSGSAMVYIMNEGRPLGAPGRYYYEVIRQGYIDAGFDISFLNKAVRDSISAAEKSEV
jgi:hypothetical protein